MTTIILNTAAGDPLEISIDQNGKQSVSYDTAKPLDPPEFDHLITRTMFDEIVKLRGELRDGFAGIPAQDEKRANSLKNAPSEIQTNFTAVLTDIAEGVNAIAQHLRESEAPTRASIDAERAWEFAMMAAIGEDGIASVVEAIRKLKNEHKAATIASSTFRCRAEGLQRDLDRSKAQLTYTGTVAGLLRDLLEATSEYSKASFVGRAIAMRKIRKIEAEIDALPPYREGDAT